MFKQKILNLAKNVLESVKKKDVKNSLNYTKALFNEIFESNFSKKIDENGILRYKSLKSSGNNVSFWGVLYENASQSGPYENFSLVIFPASNQNNDSNNQLLLCFGIGTGGITDDAEWLGLPWVKRSIKLLLKYIKGNKLNVEDTDIFVKDDITDEFSKIPDSIKNNLGDFSDYEILWKTYGKYLPSVCVINSDNDNGAKAFLSHLFLYGKFRNWPFRKNCSNILNDLISELIDLWRSYPKVDELSNYLLKRKYLILQGPPGTGKTYLATEIAKKLKNKNKNKNKINDYKIIQFHASVSYEDFVEGFKPGVKDNNLIFNSHEGPFLECINECIKNEKKGYLLIIDEINRGDIAKILGEAIFLLEPNEKRKITLRSGKKVTMPENFYIIGTMNTADRTISILDYAIRRRFAFIDVWPSSKKLKDILNNKIELKDEDKEKEIEKILNYFTTIQNIFFYYATDEELHLQPGHTYFIAKDQDELKNRIKYEIIPLLREYLNEGKLVLAKNEILAFIEKNEN